MSSWCGFCFVFRGGKFVSSQAKRITTGSARGAHGTPQSNRAAICHGSRGQAAREVMRRSQNPTDRTRGHGTSPVVKDFGSCARSRCDFNPPQELLRGVARQGSGFPTRWGPPRGSSPPSGSGCCCCCHDDVESSSRLKTSSVHGGGPRLASRTTGRESSLLHVCPRAPHRRTGHRAGRRCGSVPLAAAANESALVNAYAAPGPSDHEFGPRRTHRALPAAQPRAGSRRGPTSRPTNLLVVAMGHPHAEVYYSRAARSKCLRSPGIPVADSHSSHVSALKGRSRVRRVATPFPCGPNPACFLGGRGESEWCSEPQ